MVIVNSVNISLSALHIGQTYGRSSRKQMYPHCLQYHNFFLISGKFSVCSTFCGVASVGVSLDIVNALACFFMGLRSGMGCVAVFPSTTSFLTYNAQ